MTARVNYSECQEDLLSSSVRQVVVRWSFCGSSCLPDNYPDPRRSRTLALCLGRPVAASHRTTPRQILNMHADIIYHYHRVLLRPSWRVFGPPRVDHIGVGVQSTLGGRHFCPNNLYEKLTKCPNFTWQMSEKLSKYQNSYASEK